MGKKGGMFRGGGQPNFQNIMRQAQKMQTEMAKVQEDLAEKVIEVSGGGGAISLSINGNQEIISLAISQELIDSADQEMIQDLVMTTVNDATKKIREMNEEAMSSVTGGFPIPGL